MYKNNSGLIVKTKVSKYNKVLCLTEKLVRENPLLLIHVFQGQILIIQLLFLSCKLLHWHIRCSPFNYCKCP